MVRLKISGLDDDTHVGALKRTLNLVAGVSHIEIDAERGEVVVSGDPAETLLMVQLANEGFDAEVIRDAPAHPRH